MRKRMKSAATPAGDAKKAGADAEMTDATPAAGESSATAAATATAAAAAPEAENIAEKDKGKAVAPGELEEESVYREREAAELESLVDPTVKADIGCSESGLYDLIGKLDLVEMRVRAA